MAKKKEESKARVTKGKKSNATINKINVKPLNMEAQFCDKTYRLPDKDARRAIYEGIDKHFSRDKTKPCYTVDKSGTELFNSALDHFNLSLRELNEFFDAYVITNSDSAENKSKLKEVITCDFYTILRDLTIALSYIRDYVVGLESHTEGATHIISVTCKKSVLKFPSFSKFRYYLEYEADCKPNVIGKTANQIFQMREQAGFLIIEVQWGAPRGDDLFGLITTLLMK